MQVTVELRDAASEKRSVSIGPGQSVAVGSSERAAEFVVNDETLSGVHFSLECSESGCQLFDFGTRSGTFVNGAKVGRTAIGDGDEIRAGRLAFVVRFGKAESRTTAAAAGRAGPLRAAENIRVGPWAIGAVPPGWEAAGEGKLRRNEGTFPSAITLAPIPSLPGVPALLACLQSRIVEMRQTPAVGDVEDARPSTVGDFDDAAEFTVRFHGPIGERPLQRQLYVRKGEQLCVAMLVTRESDLAEVEPSFTSVVESLSFAREDDPGSRGKSRPAQP